MLSVLRAAAEHPNHPALVSELGVTSYGALAELVLPRARWLLAGEFARLAVVAERRLEPVLMMLAAIESGVPLVLLHSRWPSQERRAALEQADADCVVDEGFQFPGLAAAGEDVLTPEPEDIDPEACLAVVFTSGSTGGPRGVVLSRRAFVAAAEASAGHLGWSEEDRWLVSLPLAHVGGFSILIRALLARRTAVLAAPGSFSAAELVDQVDSQDVTLMSLVPATLRRLLDHEPQWQPGSAVRAILVGGAACPESLEERARARAWPILLTYGMTETCGQVATQRPGRQASTVGAAGSVLPGVLLSIDEGQILVGGPTLCSAVLGDQQSPLDVQGRFHTGDLGRLSDAGELWVLGRADARIHSGGEKLHPSEVEAAVLSFAGIAAACAVGLPDPQWGEVVAVAVQPAPGKRIDLAALELYLREQLAPWKRPKQIEVLAELPHTASGKVDRARLRDWLAASSAGRTA
jgi:O-succinylbenzoic acid--CoA ligase